MLGSAGVMIERVSRKRKCLSALFEIALVLVRLDHVAGRIVNATALCERIEKLTAFIELTSAI